MKKLIGEYEHQQAMVVLFPYRTDVWHDNALPAQKMIIKLVNAIAKYQKCVLGVLPELIQWVQNNFELHPNVELLAVKYNDSWARDSLSSVLVEENGNKSVNAFDFNAYGTPLYYPYDDDRTLNQSILNGYFGYPLQKVDVVLEWGNITTDGNGTIFVVENTIVNNNRNPGKTKAELEKILLEATCSKQVIWIPRGLPFDETGGHVDNVLAFADKDTLLLSFTDDKTNSHYKRTQEIFEFLSNVTNAQGQKYNIVKVPVPDIHIRNASDSKDIDCNVDSFARLEGDKVLYTYVNFALINGAVILPKFGIELDSQAKAIIQKHFPDRDVIQLDAREAFLGGGGFHCLTKHIN